MTRTISASMASILQHLELERPALVTMEDLSRILETESVRTPARIVASRLRDTGWLIPTAQRGVWEFAPAELAGAFSYGDPLIGLRSYIVKHPSIKCGLTFQAAAWAHGHSNRIPTRPEVAMQNSQTSRTLPKTLYSSVYVPVLEYERINEIPVLAIESIVAHMCERPSTVKSWESAIEWLTELTEELTQERMMIELSTRPQSVKSRIGYLLQRLRPDIAEMIYAKHRPTYKTWFGPRKKTLRHDNKWLVADTILPFAPTSLETEK